MQKITCVIPARLASSRFPRKILAPLHGRPLLQWVWEAATRSRLFDSIVVAVDDDETAEVVRGFGGRAEMTSIECVCGTERLVELVQQKRISGDIFVNWQGDEPFIEASMIATLLQTCDSPIEDVWTLKKKITDSSQVLSPHTAKVVTDAKGMALYFSRAAIPFYREPRLESEKMFYKHIGIYAFSRAALLQIGELKLCPLEDSEQLEQLRWLFYGLRIRVHETDKEVQGIDVPEHLASASKILAQGFVCQV